MSLELSFIKHSFDSLISKRKPLKIENDELRNCIFIKSNGPLVLFHNNESSGHNNVIEGTESQKALIFKHFVINSFKMLVIQRFNRRSFALNRN